MKINIPAKTLKNGFSMPVFGLGTWQMEKEDIEKLDKFYPDQQDVSDVCPLI